MKFIWIGIVFFCGALLPVQAGLNAKLGKSLESPAYSSLICFFVGALTMVLYLPFSRENLHLQTLRSTPWPTLLGGGLTGAVFITATMLSLPRLGMALTFSLVVAGQMIVAVALDHLGILIDTPHTINIWRLLGIALVIAGVVVVRRF